MIEKFIQLLDIGLQIWNSDIATIFTGFATFGIIFALFGRLIGRKG